jgi:hypothetical protein
MWRTPCITVRNIPPRPRPAQQWQRYCPIPRVQHSTGCYFLESGHVLGEERRILEQRGEEGWHAALFRRYGAHIEDAREQEEDSGEEATVRHCCTVKDQQDLERRELEEQQRDD